jgi:hypothetical protein
MYMENNTDATATAAPSVEDRFTVETNIATEQAEPEKVEPPKVEATEVSKPDTEPDEEPTEQKSINPRTAQRKAERERSRLEIAKLQEEVRRLQQERVTVSDAPNAKDTSKAPKVEDYEDVLEYAAALAEWKAGEIFEKRTFELSLKKQEESLAERFEVLREEKPDLDEKIDALVKSKLVTPEIYKAILASPAGADVSYHLANCGQDLMFLRGMPPEALPKAIKTIEAFIKKGGEQQEKPKITKAEPPITPPGVTIANRDVSSYSQQEIEDMPLSQYKILTGIRK